MIRGRGRLGVVPMMQITVGWGKRDNEYEKRKSKASTKERMKMEKEERTSGWRKVGFSWGEGKEER